MRQDSTALLALNLLVYFLILSPLALAQEKPPTFTLVNLGIAANPEDHYCAVRVTNVYGCTGDSEPFTSTNKGESCGQLSAKHTHEVCGSAKVTLDASPEMEGHYGVSFSNGGDGGKVQAACNLTSLDEGTNCTAISPAPEGSVSAAEKEGVRMVLVGVVGGAMLGLLL
ncbi:MAG: hypothetical protein Q9167_005505 [Letrouitia subvulpina]